MTVVPTVVNHNLPPGRVVDVVPGSEHGPVADPLGHDAQPAAGCEGGPQAIQLLTRRRHVLGDLAQGDEIVGSRQGGPVRGIKGIVERHLMAGFLEHRRQCRSRAATEIEPLGIRRQPSAQR